MRNGKNFMEQNCLFKKKIYKFVRNYFFVGIIFFFLFIKNVFIKI